MKSIPCESPLRGRLLAFSQVACVVLVASGFVGWVTRLADFGRFERTVASVIAPAPETSLALILGGMGLYRQVRPPKRPRMPPEWGSAAIAASVLLIGFFKLLGYFWPDLFLFGQPMSFLNQLSSPGSVSMDALTPAAGFGLLIGGLIILLRDFEKPKGFRPSEILSLLLGSLALLAAIGHCYRLLSLHRETVLPMTLGTTVGFALWSLAALSGRPGYGLMLIFTSQTTGGVMARRLLPVALLVPGILGAIGLMGERRGYFQTEFGDAILCVASTLIFMAMIWWNAKLLYQADRQRERAQRRLAIQYGAARVLAVARSLVDGLPKVLQAICEALGWRMGMIWMIDRSTDRLHPLEIWPAVAEGPLAEFLKATRELVLSPGVGLAGRVWETGSPLWISDVTTDANFSRAPLALKSSLHTGLGVPIRLRKETLGVMEFLSEASEGPDPMLLEVLMAVGTQIGQFIERNRAEERLRQASANLERSNADLQQFAYVASHDLFEPLRTITSYLGLLQHRYGDKLDAQAREFVAFAVDGAKRMQMLIDDLLAYARVDSRGHPFEPTVGERVLEAAMSNLKVAVEESGATISHDALPTVSADRVQLTQVLQNLIGNTIKFHGTASPSVHVSAHRRDGEWLFSVRDNGIGIEPRNFERIFAIFQRLHTRQEYSGTGMGLSICKKIVERHGGRLWVESVPGQGSTFFFTLPASHPPESTQSIQS